SAPSASASLAVSRPMPALPPITTTVCPRKAGSPRVGGAAVSVVIVLLSSVRRRRSRGYGPGLGRDLTAERLQRLDVDLREGRKRLDRVAQDIDRNLGADGEGGL